MAGQPHGRTLHAWGCPTRATRQACRSSVKCLPLPPHAPAAELSATGLPSPLPSPDPRQM